MSPRARKSLGGSDRKLGAKRLARFYVALVRGGITRSERFDGTQKRGTFDVAKAWAREKPIEGTIVELRKDSATGALIERVVLVKDCGQWRWKQAFET